MTRRSRIILLSVLGIALIGILVGPTIVKYLSPKTAQMKVDEKIRRDLPLGSSKAKVTDYVTDQGWEVYVDPERVNARIRGAAFTEFCRIDISMNFRFDSEGDLNSYSSDEFSICL